MTEFVGPKTEIDFTKASPTPDEYALKAKRLVAENFNTTFSASLSQGSVAIDEDFYIVWFVKVLGNWKALVSTDIVDNCYWEVTYNGAKNETYVDFYIKSGNAAFSDEWYASLSRV